MSFKSIEKIEISLIFHKRKTFHVGTLALREGKLYFEYKDSFLKSELEISPLRFPLSPGVKTFDPLLFEGLPGVFYDSLPDGWGRLLLDRKVRLKGILPQSLSALDRLFYVGQKGMGALSYEPSYEDKKNYDSFELEDLALACQNILKGQTDEELEKLFLLQGSSSGARPKITVGLSKNKDKIFYDLYKEEEDFDLWLIKFPNTNDGSDSGAIEYVYSLMAKLSGLHMTETHLFVSKKEKAYFGTQRFDRTKKDRLHAHSACGLLHSDFRTPCLDYEDLIKLTVFLTKDIQEAEKMFHLAVFNVLSHNCDDHSKNFSFLMNSKGEWRLSPSYDLTFSYGLGGYQSTQVKGEGKNISQAHLMKLGEIAQLSKRSIHNIIGQVKEALRKWPSLSKEHGVSKEMSALIDKVLQRKIKIGG